MSHIQLEFSSILQVPLQNYYNDFTFIVNGQEFQTSSLISDLLSPKISQIHTNDPTFDIFTINIEEHGDFSHILQLVNFKSNELPEDEIPFVTHILEILNNDTIKIRESKLVELTKDNILTEIKKHEVHSKYFQERYLEEIEFISSNFAELVSTKESELQDLTIFSIEKVLSNEHLSIETEDSLLRFVNKLYERDRNYSILYEHVYFINVTSSCMKEFTRIFDKDDMNGGTWKSIMERLESECQRVNEVKRRTSNYKKETGRGQVFQPSENELFSGMINYIRENGNIDNDLQVTASSIGNSGERYQPWTVLLKENSGYYFYTDDKPGSWLTIDFKDHRIIPTAYTIRSGSGPQSWHHPKSWVIQVSNDSNTWQTIDTVNDSPYQNGNRVFHAYKIGEEQRSEFRYFKILQTSKTLNNCDLLLFETIEIYGTLI
ncbi:hypothetical protein M9Y10_032655 [Tritrichomonas musculus]|uniref:F5/8 type C domain-containing protein n=1 Tax=Tritrichomonas musculus TaxID=1915356 RepID=A0ABR2GY83_9EUKA